jgi:hypothetical protein
MTGVSFHRSTNVSLVELSSEDFGTCSKVTLAAGLGDDMGDGQLGLCRSPVA